MAGLQRVSSMASHLPVAPLPPSHRNQRDAVYEVQGIGHSQSPKFKLQHECSSSYHKPQKEKVYFQLTQDKAGSYDTPISHLVTKFKLPTIAKVQKDFPVAKNDPSLKTGDLLLLHFIGQQRKVPAYDEYGKKTWLFLDDQELYDILPHDPSLDLKQFYGTDAVIKNNPLPKRLRIVKMSHKYIQEYGLEVGEVLEISHVESRAQVSKTGDIRGIVCSCNGKQVYLTQHTTDIIYSCTVSKESLPVSTILERNLRPARIRRTKDNRVFSLPEEPEDIELQLIATHKDHNRVLAIPLDCPLLIERIVKEDTEELLQGMLPAMYALINYTGKVQRVEQKPSKVKPILRGPKPVLPYARKHSLSIDETRVPLASSRTGTNVPLQDVHCPDRTNTKPQLKPKPQPARRSKSFVIPRSKQKELFSICDDTQSSEHGGTQLTYDDAPSLVGSTAEPETTLPIYDDASSLVSSGPENEEIYDDASSLVSLTAEPEGTLPIYDDASSIESSRTEPEEESPIYEIRSRLMIPSSKSKIYDDVFAPVLSDRTSGSSFPERKTKPRFKQNLHGNGTGDYPLRSASIDGVADFLRECHLDSWIDRFREASIDGEFLCKLDETFLRGMGMRAIEAKRLILNVNKVSSTVR